MIQKDDKYISVFFVGRLEKEKGADILLEVIQKSIDCSYLYKFFIFGDGSYFSYFSNFDKRVVQCYGHVEQHALRTYWKYADVLFMPSRFLETFGLVALEALEEKVPVIGFAHGGLTSFIQPEHVLSFERPVETFFQVVTQLHIPPVSVEKYGYPYWKKRLQKLIGKKQRILLIHDYATQVGGAEVYVMSLHRELSVLGCEVCMIGYDGVLSSFRRKLAFFLSFFAIGRFFSVRRTIQVFQPDLIFSHSVLRYIGIWGVLAIRFSHVTHYMMHHDLGMISPRPSRLYQERDIPQGWRYASWIRGERNIFYILVITLKYLWLRIFWRVLPKETLHFVPSNWMVPYFSRITKSVRVFPHTNFPAFQEGKKI